MIIRGRLLKVGYEKKVLFELEQNSSQNQSMIIYYHYFYYHFSNIFTTKIYIYIYIYIYISGNSSIANNNIESAILEIKATDVIY